MNVVKGELKRSRSHPVRLFKIAISERGKGATEGILVPALPRGHNNNYPVKSRNVTRNSDKTQIARKRNHCVIHAYG